MWWGYFDSTLTIYKQNGFQKFYKQTKINSIYLLIQKLHLDIIVLSFESSRSINKPKF